MKLRLLLALVISCTTLPAQEEEDTWPEAFSKHFKGTIGDKLEVEMQLQAEPGSEVLFGGKRQFRGHYWYANKRIPIDLFGDEPSFGKVKLDEQVFAGGQKGWEITGTFNGELKDDGTISGTWTDGDGKRKLPFKLAPFQPSGAVKVTAHALESSWTERTAAGAASLEHTAFLVLVAGDSPAARRINQTLLKHACAYFTEPEEGAEDADNKDGAKAKSPAKEAEKALTLDSVSEVLLAERDEDLIADHQKWSESCTAGVELNERGILCVSHLFSEYTGGAHPNSVTEYFTFDTRTGAELTLKQLFKPGFLEALPKLATEKFRKQEGAPPKDEPGPTIESLNFEEGEAAWFLSAAGFVVHFDPYAIASYARGNVDLLIPWSELETWLAPDSPLKPFVTKAK